MKKRLQQLRINLLKILLRDDEKYLLAKAIDSYKETIEKERVSSKLFDRDDSDRDSEDYSTIRRVCSTNLWR